LTFCNERLKADGDEKLTVDDTLTENVKMDIAAMHLGLNNLYSCPLVVLVLANSKNSLKFKDTEPM